jgi:hypothetical protein
MAIEVKDWIAVWGAVVGTGLGVLRAWEFATTAPKFKLLTSYSLSDEEHGNVIAVINASDRPVQVLHWALYWSSPVRGRMPIIDALDVQSSGFRIDAHSTERLSFVEGDWFQWTGKKVSGALCLDLEIAGRAKQTTLIVRSGMPASELPGAIESG